MIKHTTELFGNIRQFSARDIAFKENSQKFKSFIPYSVELDEIGQVIDEKKSHYSQSTRQIMADVVNRQYASMDKSSAVSANLDALYKDNTFMVVTAHQPCLLTGPLYVVLKIASAVKWAMEIQKKHPDYQVVPVFVLGSEDHDFEEINHLHLFDKEFKLEATGDGTVGDRKWIDALTLKQTILDMFGNSQYKADIESLLTLALQAHISITDSIRNLINALFSKFGVLVVDMLVPEFKSLMKPIFKNEIFNSFSHPLVTKNQDYLNELGYSSQIYSRPINLFYLSETRDRIIRESDDHFIAGTHEFTKLELEELIEHSPERFSPNVVLRPLFQETILPNLAYIGGGAEVAYWMEIHKVFDQCALPYPMLMRRDSVIWISGRSHRLMEQLALPLDYFFDETNEVIKKYIHEHTSYSFDPELWKNKFTDISNALGSEIELTDPTIKNTVDANQAQLEKFVDKLDSKLAKVLKVKNETQINRIKKLKGMLFPNEHLQERKLNILEIISETGLEIIDDIVEHMAPHKPVLHIFTNA